MPLPSPITSHPLIVAGAALCVFIGWVLSGNDVHLYLSLLLAIVSGELLILEERDTETWILIEVKSSTWRTICRMRCHQDIDGSYKIRADLPVLQTILLLSALAPVRMTIYEKKKSFGDIWSP